MKSEQTKASHEAAISKATEEYFNRLQPLVKMAQELEFSITAYDEDQRVHVDKDDLFAAVERAKMLLMAGWPMALTLAHRAANKVLQNTLNHEERSVLIDLKQRALETYVVGPAISRSLDRYQDLIIARGTKYSSILP